MSGYQLHLHYAPNMVNSMQTGETLEMGGPEIDSEWVWAVLVWDSYIFMGLSWGHIGDGFHPQCCIFEFNETGVLRRQVAGLRESLRTRTG